MTTGGKTALVEAYRDFDARCATVLDRFKNAREYEAGLYVPCKEDRQEATKQLEALLDEASNLPAPGPVYELLKNHFDEYLRGQVSYVKRMFEAPGAFISGLSGAIDYYSRKDSRESAERAKILLTRLGKAGEFWAGVESFLTEMGIEEVRQMEDACDTLALVADKMKPRLPQLYPGLSPKAIAQLEHNLEKTAARAKNWEAKIKEFAEKSSAQKADTAGVPDDGRIENYRYLLRNQFGVELDEILSWHEEEIEKTRTEMFEIANSIDVAGVPKANTVEDVVYILNRYEGPCEAPDEMFERMREYLDRAQEAARDYVRLPEESVIVVPTPETLVKHYPWGGYGGGCPRRRPLQGETILNVANYKAITDGWIKMCAIHECYPGHHVQWLRALLDPLPETVKAGARGVPTLEGSAHRSERLMEFVFPEDPFYPLFVAYRRHHTSVRIKADLWLRYFERPLGDIVGLYVQELGFERKVAEGQVLAQQIMTGYFTCYYYGMKRLADLQDEFGYNDKDFTEVIFSLPRVSLKTMENFLKLGDDGKNRVLTGFPSKVEL